VKVVANQNSKRFPKFHPSRVPLYTNTASPTIPPGCDVSEGRPRDPMTEDENLAIKFTACVATSFGGSMQEVAELQHEHRQQHPAEKL